MNQQMTDFINEHAEKMRIGLDEQRRTMRKRLLEEIATEEDKLLESIKLSANKKREAIDEIFGADLEDVKIHMMGMSDSVDAPHVDPLGAKN